jgi:hypothetical protein
VQLKAAIDNFFLEFSKFEISAIGTTLRALSQDAAYVEQTEKLLDLEARLTLLLRLSAARGVPSSLSDALEAIVSRARILRAQRDEIAQHVMAAGKSLNKPDRAAAPPIRVTCCCRASLKSKRTPPRPLNSRPHSATSHARSMNR